MKRFYKGMALALTTGLLALGLAGCGQPSDASSSDSSYQETGGVVGDTMHNVFFDFTVNSVETADSYAGYTPEEGNRLLIADMTIVNTFPEAIPMWDDDFIIEWGSGVDEYDVPLEVLDEQQLPEEYELDVDEERSGLLVFEVPAEQKDFVISYLEFFDDNTEGDLYYVEFSVE